MWSTTSTREGQQSARMERARGASAASAKASHDAKRAAPASAPRAHLTAGASFAKHATTSCAMVVCGTPRPAKVAPAWTAKIASTSAVAAFATAAPQRRAVNAPSSPFVASAIRGSANIVTRLFPATFVTPYVARDAAATTTTPSKSSRAIPATQRRAVAVLRRASTPNASVARRRRRVGNASETTGGSHAPDATLRCARTARARATGLSVSAARSTSASTAPRKRWWSARAGSARNAGGGARSADRARAGAPSRM
mmetsp:Transcript_9062/g.29769  ORF Transcript_9062/g.29769 Transcript_9062/m.29769 type:complete len:256 (-) Transcript_9062:26-793(-)